MFSKPISHLITPDNSAIPDHGGPNFPDIPRPSSPRRQTLNPLKSPAPQKTTQLRARSQLQTPQKLPMVWETPCIIERA